MLSGMQMRLPASQRVDGPAYSGTSAPLSQGRSICAAGPLTGLVEGPLPSRRSVHWARSCAGRRADQPPASCAAKLSTSGYLVGDRRSVDHHDLCLANFALQQSNVLVLDVFHQLWQIIVEVEMISGEDPDGELLRRTIAPRPPCSLRQRSSRYPRRTRRSGTTPLSLVGGHNLQWPGRFATWAEPRGEIRHSPEDRDSCRSPGRQSSRCRDQIPAIPCIGYVLALRTTTRKRAAIGCPADWNLTATSKASRPPIL